MFIPPPSLGDATGGGGGGRGRDKQYFKIASLQLIIRDQSIALCKHLRLCRTAIAQENDAIKGKKMHRILSVLLKCLNHVTMSNQVLSQAAKAHHLSCLFPHSFSSLCLPHYRKTPLISTYVFSGLATEQVLIFGAVLTFGGYDKTEWKILQGRSLFNPVLSAHNTLLCMFQRLCTYFQDTGVLKIAGYVLSGYCNRQ